MVSANLKNNLDASKSQLERSSQFVGKGTISILVFYYMWFNEKIGHNAIIVYGAFLVLFANVLIDIICKGYLDLRKFHVGIWMNFIIAFYALMTGVFVSLNQDTLFEYTRISIQYSFIVFAVFYYSNVMEDNKDIDWMLIIINISALICCISLFTRPYQIISGRYCLSPRNNPNTLGIILVLGIFSVALRLKPEPQKLFLGLLQMGMMLYGIIMTGSRKSLIAATVFIILSICEILKETKKTIEGWAGVTIVILILVIIIFGARYLLTVYYQSKVSHRMDIILDEDSIGNRLLFYRKAWEIFLEKPFIGGGLGQFRYWSGTGSYAHSTYAEAIADFGLIGCIMYFFPMVVTGYRAIINVIFGNRSYRARLVLIMLVVELFVGVGQIFFVDFIHYIIWTILFYYTTEVIYQEKPQLSKYLR